MIADGLGRNQANEHWIHYVCMHGLSRIRLDRTLPERSLSFEEISRLLTSQIFLREITVKEAE